jgi:DNA polymerase kappa
MPGFIAKKLCPHLVVVSPNFHKYHKASEQVKKVLTLYDPTFCPVGLDESYLDITNFVTRKLNAEGKELDTAPAGFSRHSPKLSKSHWLYAEQVVQDIRTEVYRTTGLTASAGIATNKVLAKVASDANKPNGQLLVDPSKEDTLKFIRGLPIRKVRLGMITELLTALLLALLDMWYRQSDRKSAECSGCYPLSTSF